MARRVGRYEVLDTLSSGGMATVHIGRLIAESGFRKLVAIKRIHEGLAGDRELRAMLRDEARLVARVRHASVVSTLDVVEEGDELLLVMEYAHGPSLAQIARGPGALPVPIVAAVMGDVLEGLHAAHEATDEAGRSLCLVHRDVSPENVIVGVDGVARVLDFGVAYATVRSQRTMPGHVKGKPAYMAPEQAQGEDADRRVDVYAASVILWELLTGTRLFPAGSAAGAMLRHLEEIPKPPSALRPGLTPALDAIVLRGLAKRADDRFPTARAMAEALEAAAPRASRAETGAWIAQGWAAFLAERDALLARVESAEEGAASMTPAVTARAVPPSRGRAWALALGAAALVGIGALAWPRSHASAPSAVAASPAMPRGTRGEPLKLVVLPVATDPGDADLEPALTAMAADLVNDAPETVTGGLRRTRAAARTLQPDGPPTPATWLAAAAQVGAPAALVASALTDASGYAVTLRLVEPKSGAVWFERHAAAASRDATLGALADLVLALRSALGDSSTPDQQLRAGNAFRSTTIAAAAAYARSSEQTQSGSWDVALREANAAVLADPSFAMGRFAQALAYGNAGRSDDAERSYRATLAQLDRLSEANRLLASGLYFTVRREPPQAIEQLRKYVERYPSNFGGAMDLANAYFANRDMANAEKEGRRAYEMGKAPVALANLALYASYAGDFEEAVRDARSVLALGGDSAETAVVALAHAELGLGSMNDARAAYTTLAQQGATAASRAALGQADLALAEGRLADAERLLRARLDGGADSAPPNRAALAETLLRMGHREQALEVADPLADTHDPALLLTLGRLYAQAGAGSRAMAIVKQLDARVDHESRSYAALVRGEVLLEGGHAREAIVHFEDSRKEAEPWLARFDLGRAYLQLGLYPEAYQELEACTKRHGEALALLLDDVPTYRYWVPVAEQLARAKEGLRKNDAP